MFKYICLICQNICQKIQKYFNFWSTLALIDCIATFPSNIYEGGSHFAGNQSRIEQGINNNTRERENFLKKRLCLIKLTPFVKYICQICHMYLSKISKIFVWFLKCVMFCTWVSLRGKVKPTTTQERGHIESLWVLLSTEGSLLSLHCNALLSMLNESRNRYDCFVLEKGWYLSTKCSNA